MNEKASSSCGFWLAVSGFGLALSAGAALADNTADVVVQADNSPITVTRAAPGSPVHLVSLARHVSYRDIDFNSPTADAQLQKRISAAATDVCRKLGESFPDSTPSGRACTEIAVKDALRKVHASKMSAAQGE